MTFRSWSVSINGVLAGGLAIVINTLLNLMDAATYGRLFFPIYNASFSDFGPFGMSMYLFCTAASQLIISLFSSFRKGSTGCSIIENIPFYHNISLFCLSKLVRPDKVISTIVASYFLISIITGLIFLLLASTDVDRIVHKFPRVVLVGLMGGIGIFLIITGIEHVLNNDPSVAWGSRAISSNSLLVLSLSIIVSIIALVAEINFKIQYIPALFPIMIVLAFYLFWLISPYSLEELRNMGWLIDSGTQNISPFEIYSKISIEKVSLTTIFKQFLTILGAAFFGSMHVPINVPSFARLTGQSFCMKRELLVQSISNFITSFIGFVPNYFVYTNSLLFLKAGGKSRISGVILAISTFGMLFIGQEILKFVPTVVILFLTFFLGFSLIYEAVIASYRITLKHEYIIIWGTIALMNAFGFLFGLLVSVIIAVTNGFLLYYIQEEMIISNREDDIDIGSPVFEGLLNSTTEYVHLVEYEGYLFFKNSADNLSKLNFVHHNSKMFIVDFRRVFGMDLNMREGITAQLTSCAFDDQILVCLGLKDQPLIRMLQRANIILDNCSPLQFIQKYLLLQLNKLLVEDPLDHTVMLIQAEKFPFNEEDLKKFDNNCNDLAILNTCLRPISNTIYLHRREPLSAQLPDAKGLICVLKGRLKLRDSYFGEGAWLGLDENGLAGVICIEESTVLYIPEPALKTLDTQNHELLNNICKYGERYRKL